VVSGPNQRIGMQAGACLEDHLVGAL
jgi:hypothetical protein